MHRITNVEVLPRFRLHLTFEDGSAGTVDLSGKVGKGVFGPLLQEEAFARVRVSRSGGLSWGDEVDLCPDALYMEATGASPGEVFPALKTERTRA
ncbi:MAG: DUF2442 domain-containing protein [Planctomycetota bacterium]|jgi:hypothetical protein